MMNPDKAELLKPLGQNADIQEEDVERIKEFIRTVLYGGKENETYVGTHIRLYQNLKQKSSMPLPPDPDSVIQVIKRAHHQSYSWIPCGLWVFSPLPYEGNGWLIDKTNSVGNLCGSLGNSCHFLHLESKNMISPNYIKLMIILLMDLLISSLLPNQPIENVPRNEND